MTAFWIALGAIAAAFIARGVKISEFRQAWIDGLRSDISEYISKAHEWVDLYLVFNSEGTQEKKAEIAPKLDGIKYDALHILSRINLRFKPDDENANILLGKLLGLLDPEKLVQKNEYSSWRKLSDEAVMGARTLLKEEWEVTKNPLSKLKLQWCGKSLTKKSS
ncbi:MAG: hypothetical protein K9L22_12230 [Methylococcaceae bacterium]|nr:hypothetical protein [Methylococcaceae bacterium]